MLTPIYVHQIIVHERVPAPIPYELDKTVKFIEHGWVFAYFNGTNSTTEHNEKTSSGIIMNH